MPERNMTIDIIAIVLLFMAVIKGWQRGLLIAVFSMLAFVIGIAAAMKLSVVVAGYLKGSVNISAKWLPVISFVLIFAIVVLLIRWGANLLEDMLEMVLMGWINKLAGIILYVVLYMLAFSVILFYAHELRLINDAAIRKSVTWPWIQPWGPYVINKLGQLLPLFKDMFTDLENFFSNIAHHAGSA